MAKKRKAYAPFSLTSEAGVAQTPVEGYIDVDQMIYPTVSTGTVNENGKWTGVKSNDPEFMGFTKALAVADSGEFLAPDTNNHPSINMEGFRHLQFIVKASSNADTQLYARTGPDTIKCLNVTLQAAEDIRLAGIGDPANDVGFASALNDTSETISSGYRLFTVYDRLKDVNNFQILVKNVSGSNRDYEFAFRRLI